MYVCGSRIATRGPPGPVRPSVSSPRYFDLGFGSAHRLAQHVGDLEADVVASAVVLGARIAEADDQPVDGRSSPRHYAGLTGLLALVPAFGLAGGVLAGSPPRPPRRSRPRPRARSPPRSLAPPRAAASAASAWRSTVSGSSSSVTPARRLTASSVTVSPICSSETSWWMASGMSSGSASIVSSRVTCSSTPPSLTPGASSAPTRSSTTVALIACVEPHPQHVDVDRRAGDRVSARSP